MARALIALVTLLACARVARAEDGESSRPSYRIVVDRIEHEPSSLGGTRLHVFLSALTLQGQQLDLTEPNTIKTFLGSSEIKAPFALGTFGATHGQLAIVVVVQATLEYNEMLPVILEQLDTVLLAGLDEKTTQFAILAYGEAVGSGKLQPLKTARGKVKGVTSDGTAGDPALVETVERALMMLKKAKTAPEGLPLRKIILLIGDGRDRAGDRDRVTRLGTRAAKEDVRIHSFAYSPTDQRRPLLLLGELSRKSLGTFRWLQIAQADSWKAKFTQALEEIQKQYVVTYFPSRDDDPTGRKLKVQTVGRVEATSNELKVPEALCGGATCGGYCVDVRCVMPREPEGRGVLGWILLVGGIAIGALLVLSGIGWVLSKRQQSIPLPPGMELPPGFAQPPPPKAKKQKKAPGVPLPAAPQTAAFLMFLSGPRAGERIAVFNGFLIGKVPGNHLVIEDGYTSSNHAQIVTDPQGNWRVIDRGSTNGTFVDNVRITELTLVNGVTLRIGATDFRFLAV